MTLTIPALVAHYQTAIDNSEQGDKAQTVRNHEEALAKVARAVEVETAMGLALLCVKNGQEMVAHKLLDHAAVTPEETMPYFMSALGDVVTKAFREND